MTPRHRRGDRVAIVGSGPQAYTVKTAACRCGWTDDRPRSTEARDIEYRRHREAAS